MKNILYVVLLAILIFGISLIVKRGHVRSQEGACLFVRNKILAKSNGHRPAGAFLPQCTIYGNYFPQQCDRHTKMCWCVNQKGEKIEGTEITMGSGTQPEACPMNFLARWYRDIQ